MSGEAVKIKVPEQSEWSCYLFGSKVGEDGGMVYIPTKGHHPNFFARWVMKIFFDCTWVKEREK